MGNMHDLASGVIPSPQFISADIRDTESPQQGNLWKRFFILKKKLKCSWGIKNCVKKPFERTYSTHKQNNSSMIMDNCQRKDSLREVNTKSTSTFEIFCSEKQWVADCQNFGEEAKNVADKMRPLRQQSASRERPLSAHRLKLISNKVSKFSMRVTEKRSLKMLKNTRVPHWWTCKYWTSN